MTFGCPDKLLFASNSKYLWKLLKMDGLFLVPCRAFILSLVVLFYYHSYAMSNLNESNRILLARNTRLDKYVGNVLKN